MLIVNGQIVRMSPTGSKPGRAAGKIAASLVLHEEQHGGGYAYGDNVGFVVNLPNRDSFSPDAAWFIGAPEAVEVLKRSRIKRISSLKAGRSDFCNRQASPMTNGSPARSGRLLISVSMNASVFF